MSNQITPAVADVVCPVHFRPVAHPHLAKPLTDRYGRTLRTYFIWCPQCHAGYEVEQFSRDGRWVIGRYRQYKLFGSSLVTRPAGPWQKLNDMPDPDPVVLGPGGDYDQPVDPKIAHRQIRKKLNKIVSLIGQINRDLAGLWEHYHD